MADDDWRALDPGVVRLWRQQLALPLAGVVVAGLGALAGAAARDVVAYAVGPVVVVVATGLALLVRYPPLRYRTWRYRLGAEALEVAHGAVIRRRSVVPYFRVQNVDLSSGPLERRLGLVRLKLRTAAPGTDAEIPGLREDDAAAARAWILERAGTTTGV